MTATDDPSSNTLVSSSPGTTASVWKPARRYPASNSSGIGAAAYSNVMWRTLPLLGETAAMDPSIVIGVQDLFAQYAHRIDGRDFDGFGLLFTADADYSLAGNASAGPRRDQGLHAQRHDQARRRAHHHQRERA